MSMPGAASGFVLPGLLVLLTLAALVVADALVESTASAALATRLQLRQGAFEAAQAAVDAGESALARGATAAAAIPATEGALRTHLRVGLDRREALVEGFSAGRFTLEHLRITALAEAPRGTRLELGAGYARWSATP